MNPALVTDLRSTLSVWTPPAPAQGRERVRWSRLAEDPSSLGRDGEPAHFTASALPVDRERARVCLVLHGRIGAWVQPGGHLEVDDVSIAGAAARELEEETGLAGRLDPVPLLLSRHPAPCGRGEWHLDLQLLAVVDPVTPLRVSPESDDVAWFPFDSLPSRTAPGVERLVRMAQARLSRNAPPAPPAPGG